MLDLFGIVFSSGIMFLVILRAVQMDSVQPWFQPPKLTADSSGLRLRPGNPASDNAAEPGETPRHRVPRR
jgi:hypothetical protein